jgi:hypothetical protein
MSSTTWTPDALWRERRRLSASCWRVVEAQHRVSTLKLVDTLDEQALLEDLIERTKASVPVECRQLHYLLFTPFRYGAPYPTGSRFRRAGFTPGVFYASATAKTAIAEMAFHRLLFYADSPETPWPQDAGEYTAFSASYATRTALDLTAAPLNRDRASWTHVSEYEACQVLAERARATGIDVVRYESVRDPDPARGINVALLACGAFQSRRPTGRQTWRMHFNAAGVRAICEAPRQQAGFAREAFAVDPRIAVLRWQREPPRR